MLPKTSRFKSKATRDFDTTAIIGENVTLFHRPKKTGLLRGLRLAGRAIELSETSQPPLTIAEAVNVIATEEKLTDDQERALLRLAQQRRVHQS